MNQTTQSTAPQDEQDVNNPAVAKIIAQQNDAFRTSLTASVKAPGVPPGKLVMTAGIAAQSDEFRAALIEGNQAIDTAAYAA